MSKKEKLTGYNYMDEKIYSVLEKEGKQSKAIIDLIKEVYEFGIIDGSSMVTKESLTNFVKHNNIK